MAESGVDAGRPVPAALALIEQTLTPGTFRRWDTPLTPLRIEESYRDELHLAGERSGLDEAVVTGAGEVGGFPVAVVVGEFQFLGGSIGVNAASRIAAAFRRATSLGLPILAAPVSGGTRMQEGTTAFLQMARITQAVVAHKRAGLAYFVYLRNPTTGGVFASWGSLGHITIAEPNALIGFLGPKVYRALEGRDFPVGVQTAENLYTHGLVDAVVAPQHLGRLTTQLLTVLTARSGPATEPNSAPTPWSDGTIADVWQAVTASRSSRRPGLRTLLRHAARDVVPLSGTGQGEADPAATVSLATLAGRGVVVIGLDRRAQSSAGALGPGALRQARRGMALAEQFRLPIVTVVDTPGAALSREAEEGGLAGEIARCLAELLEVAVPTVSVLLGQGTGGAALALTPADRVIAAEHSWLAPLPPEGASIIRYGDTEHAAEMARAQRIGADALLQDGIVDEVVPEVRDAADDPDEFCRRVGAAIARHLAELCSVDVRLTRIRRAARYESLGNAPASRLAEQPEHDPRRSPALNYSQELDDHASPGGSPVRFTHAGTDFTE